MSLCVAPGKKGHHMGDFIPPEELEKFLATCNDAEAQKAAREAAERARIQADNVGHRLLSKMGWREGPSAPRFDFFSFFTAGGLWLKRKHSSKHSHVCICTDVSSDFKI